MPEPPSIHLQLALGCCGLARARRRLDALKPGRREVGPVSLLVAAGIRELHDPLTLAAPDAAKRTVIAYRRFDGHHQPQVRAFVAAHAPDYLTEVAGLNWTLHDFPFSS